MFAPFLTRGLCCKTMRKEAALVCPCCDPVGRVTGFQLEIDIKNIQRYRGCSAYRGANDANMLQIGPATIFQEALEAATSNYHHTYYHHNHPNQAVQSLHKKPAYTVCPWFPNYVKNGCLMLHSRRHDWWILCHKHWFYSAVWHGRLALCLPPHGARQPGHQRSGVLHRYRPPTHSQGLSVLCVCGTSGPCTCLTTCVFVGWPGEVSLGKP